MKTIPILMYHSISNGDEKMSVKKENFYKQMKLMIKLGFQSIKLKNIFNNFDKKSFVITFDDGYENVFENALPILNELKLEATCFFVANHIGGYNTWDISRNDFKKTKIMNEMQIKRWIDDGFDIGSHTLDHKNLCKLNYEDKTKQIADSKIFFKHKFNIDVKSFAYPFGVYDNSCIELAKKNYDCAVTTKRSRYKKNIFNKGELPRVPINSNTSQFKFFLKVSTFYEDIKFKK